MNRPGTRNALTPRRAISVTTAPGARLAATIACFCSALHRRRRSGPVMTSTLAIAPSLAPMQTPLLAPVLTSPTHRRYARRPSSDGYVENGMAAVAGILRLTNSDLRRHPRGAVAAPREGLQRRLHDGLRQLCQSQEILYRRSQRRRHPHLEDNQGTDRGGVQRVR